MTSVYGVTFIGAKEQIAKQLIKFPVFANKALLKDTSIRLAKMTLAAIEELFSPSFKMNRDKELVAGCSKKGIKVFNPSSMEITTRVYFYFTSSFYIVQPYTEQVNKRINLKSHRITMSISNPKVDVNHY